MDKNSFPRFTIWILSDLLTKKITLNSTNFTAASVVIVMHRTKSQLPYKACKTQLRPSDCSFTKLILLSWEVCKDVFEWVKKVEEELGYVWGVVKMMQIAAITQQVRLFWTVAQLAVKNEWDIKMHIYSTFKKNIKTYNTD